MSRVNFWISSQVCLCKIVSHAEGMVLLQRNVVLKKVRYSWSEDPRNTIFKLTSVCLITF